MATESSPYISQYPDAFGTASLSIALIGPDRTRREAAAQALTDCAGRGIREFSAYPAGLDDVPKLIEQQFDVIIIDLDVDPEYALELVESICVKGSTTVMVYSEKADPDLLVRCMRAGAREFLTLPFASNIMAEALVRAAARRPASRTPKKLGRMLVFLGAKGGAGVTTLACNFAVALAQEPNQSTLLIDLDLPLGDAALNLGIVPEFSTVNALEAWDRLDASFLSKLLVKHSSGLSVLSAPGKLPHTNASAEAVDKLITVARQEFDNVVIDVGSRLDMPGSSLFQDASTIYLVTQAGIPELRNANRLISQFFVNTSPKVDVVLNRFENRTLGVSEEHITKALTRPAEWKIPNDHALVKKMQISATPLVLGESLVAKQIKQMARMVTGHADAPAPKRKGFGLFGQSSK